MIKSLRDLFRAQLLCSFQDCAAAYYLQLFHYAADLSRDSFGTDLDPYQVIVHFSLCITRADFAIVNNESGKVEVVFPKRTTKFTRKKLKNYIRPLLQNECTS